MTACSGQQKPASERSESREAKRLMQGVWLDDSESAVFQAKGDTVYYADSTSMPAYFRVVDDTLYIGKEGRYHIEKQTEHLLWFKSETGELTKLSKSDDEYLDYGDESTQNENLRRKGMPSMVWTMYEAAGP